MSNNNSHTCTVAYVTSGWIHDQAGVGTVNCSDNERFGFMFTNNYGWIDFIITHK